MPHGIFNLQAMMVEPHQEFSLIPTHSYDIPTGLNEDSVYMYKNELKMDSKGRDEEYTYIFSNMVSIDLSNNQLKGVVPYSLGNFKGLKMFNIAINNLNNTIPNNIVQLSWLESLDFSRNNFLGSPQLFQQQSFKQYTTRRTHGNIH